MEQLDRPLSIENAEEVMKIIGQATSQAAAGGLKTYLMNNEFVKTPSFITGNLTDGSLIDILTDSKANIYLVLLVPVMQKLPLCPGGVFQVDVIILL